MNKGSAYHLAALVYLFFCIATNAQPFVTRIYTANNGLPDSYTQGIYQDQQGYLWIGTYTGLSRFDGEHFVTIESKNNAINGIVTLQDYQGRLWIAYDKKLGILNQDSVTGFPTSDGRAMSYIFGVVQFNNKKIWALVSGGAYEFTGHSWQKIKFPAEYEGLDCRQVIEVPDGYYINFGRVIVFRNNSGVFKRLTPYQSDQSFYINMHKIGDRIYVNYNAGMFRIENGAITEIFKEQLSQTINYNFLIDSKKRFWISTEKYGILVSDPGEEKLLRHNVSLPFNLSTFLFEDRDQNVWATNYEGLIKIKDVAFSSFNKTSDKLYDNIRFLATDHEGDVYIASTGNGLYKLPVDNAKPVSLNFSSIVNFKDDVVDGMSFDDKNNLWLITRSSRLIRYDGRNATDLTRLVNENNEGLYQLCYDADRRQFILAAEKLYIGNEEGFSSWGDKNNTKEILQPRFICKKKDGTFLINTLDSGVYLVNKNNEAVNISSQLSIVSGSRELRIYDDPTGGFWIAKPGEGLTKYMERTPGQFEKIVTITSKDGLPNNTTFSAVFDKQNKLWLTTLSGIATITYNGDHRGPQYVVHRIGAELGSEVLNWGAATIACDKQNNIWVSTFHELIKVESDKIRSQNQIPGIAIEKLTINSKTLQWNQFSDSLEGFFRIPVNPVFDHKQNTISISFQGISFSVNPGLQYSYKLTTGNLPGELDDTANWSEPTTNNNVSFVKLPPGHYSFAVKARETGTEWTVPAHFYFTIRSPFWSRWWFRGLLIILTGFLIWWITRLRIRRIQKRSEIQDQLRELEMKALKAQMNPHFIYNALNSIQSLVVDNKQQEAIKYISKFARLLRQVLEQSGKNLVSLDKELNTLDLYIQLEMLRMNMPLNYTVSIDDQVMAENEWVPPLVLQPFVENALWHGLNRKEGEKKLSLTISSDDDWISVAITDNGVGREKAAELKKGFSDYPRSMGIEITDKRLQLINRSGEMSFKIHDLSDGHGNATGTEVLIRIKRQTAPSAADKI